MTDLVTVSRHALARYLERAMGMKRNHGLPTGRADDDLIERAGDCRVAVAHQEIERVIRLSRVPLDSHDAMLVRAGGLQFIVRDGAVLTVKKRGQGHRAGTVAN